MPTVLITGANRGMGLEYARQYAADGWRVLATCRDPGAAKELAALDGDVEIYALDVTDHGQVQSLAKTLRKETIDLLLNNAGVYGPRPSKLGGIDYDAWQDIMWINVMAPLKVCECFRSHVADSDLKKIAIMSSKMGSMGDNNSGASYVYRSSKAALNAAMKSLAVDLAPRGISVVILHPGWVRTDMGGPSGLIDAPESVSGLRQVIDHLSLETTGRFYNYDGSEIPW
ncbi:MAG: SDR family oxidoreductase [Rhodospirillaceae bacterium]|jgi:NAD(P)-dependent dehydrogenase (short-subunit alcohol dehydrogenase family)|nr:SDR family oxidoreductase [Rhodospirillaceae bacterium]MBT5244278.1 SDR family oxidoreductase [Rhodospirillaceae bacterium]MBT5563639.1 SDR family oxidoreductase [Rhodospirillaceae bacterium]MBT6241469.1 SDR family oxidoreductase [Rhodospirillaceae bacterium]MBT7138828.1 SDR family oxidoreductase [Rhodospirillaceae bacterium]